MDDTTFFDQVRQSVFRPALSQDEVNGCNDLLQAAKGLEADFVAYVLATAYWETAHTMQPISEYGGDAYFTRMYGIDGTNPQRARAMGNTEPGDGIKYHGRGYVQLTWKDNYQKASTKLGVDLVDDPAAALQPKFAAPIIIHGMLEGWFSGRTLAQYLPGTGAASEQQFAEARHIVNGTDHADEIAGIALEFQTALNAAQWSSG